MRQDKHKCSHSLGGNTRFREASIRPVDIDHFEAFPVALKSHTYDLLIFHRFPWMIHQGLYKKRQT